MEINELSKEEQQAIVEFLGCTSVFSNFSESELFGLLEFIELSRLPAGYMLFREGDKGDKIYFLWEGEIEIIKQVGNLSARVALAKLKPGDVFGELAFVENLPRSSAAKALSDCLLVSFSLENAEKMFQGKPKLLSRLFWALCQLVSRRLRDTNAKVTKAIEWGYEIAQAFETEPPAPPPELEKDFEMLKKQNKNA